ncbi:hypothetical protein [Croceimicrobium hydrocarbonivorans]|uniref:Uncharacterized protein n=1 Tax=Croceimicrobium hydrocarbonivorans TaxID=2761580 RepID=A0A7H0VI05_9FLAO|nr:hypothetical protein [Croceimicrobium hydrocarbonivorans]QNR25353.1 hypothetical protein H4K34_05800 [Croceimicrobium hydrocarbonivorans]
MIFLAILCQTAWSQCEIEEIDFIIFKYSHSMRGPNNYSSIKISPNKPGDIGIRYSRLYYLNSPDSDPYEEGLKPAIIDSAFYVDSAGFGEILKQVALLENINLDSAATFGFDGDTWSIEFGNSTQSFKYSFWSPKYHSDERGLENFIALCENIIALSELKPKKIF